ncbi:MAG: ATP-binding protein [Candidatus Spechtbacterales bacterium]
MEQPQPEKKKSVLEDFAARGKRLYERASKRVLPGIASALPTQKKDPREEKRRQALYEVIAPPSVSFEATYVKIGDMYARTLFVHTYPRYLSQNWLSPIINMGRTIDVSMFVAPIPTATILKHLRSQLVSVEAEMMERDEKGLVRDPMLEAAYQNIETLRDQLQTAEEKIFKFGVYLTLYGHSLEELNQMESEVHAELESRLIYAKPALYQQKEALASSTPVNLDRLNVNTSLNTSPLSSSFPFVSFDLTDDRGILYGINRHNSSLVLFDRFSLENANTIIVGKSGGGKSYAIKLEILRSMMLGTDVIVIDPENEYQYLAKATGGSFFRVSLTSGDHINPFDLPPVDEGESPADALRGNIITLIGLLKIMLGDMMPEEESILNEAINQAYASRDITPDREDFEGAIPPTMGDLQAILHNMEGGESLAQRLEKYTTGVYAGFLNNQSNVELKGRLVVFNIRDMEDELRPVAMYMIIQYIWKNVRRELKRRILAIDEAWWMLQYPESAFFLFGIVKRARKYYLGVTTITQDISDFMRSDYGEAIITNSSMQLLMKQSPATVDRLQDTFNLTDEEKYMLLEDNVGEGLFFAGSKHVAIKVIASYVEDQIITSDPEQLLQLQKAKQQAPKPPQTNG